MYVSYVEDSRVHAYIHKYRHPHTHVLAHTRIHIHTHTHTYTHIHTGVTLGLAGLGILAFVAKNHVLAHTRIHIHTHTHTYTHIHTGVTLGLAGLGILAFVAKDHISEKLAFRPSETTQRESAYTTQEQHIDMYPSKTSSQNKGNSTDRAARGHSGASTSSERKRD
jgi:hypothetical protein